MGTAPIKPPVVASFPISGAQLKEIFPSTDQSRCDEVAEIINKYSDKFEINTPLRMAHFLGQIGAETGGLKKLKEDYCYQSKSRIKEVFGKEKYCDLFEGYESDLTLCNGSKPMQCTPKLTTITSNLVVKDKYVCSTLLFDYVYSCRMGNRAVSSKDGSTYAGIGFIHLTGRGLYKQISEKWNQDPDNSTNQKYFHLHPDENGNSDELSTDLEVAMKASMYYWDDNHLNGQADIGIGNDEIDDVGRIVNGSGKNKPNSYEERRVFSKKSYEVLK